ncbi:unnamed protein product [Prunus armeniaca]|uniref:Uncharacterized protein n=1 Tax=Prunus armeniaca TaxID=36596 RepID=A0A6J5VDW9_PRUAR|nr:unnamed protein product [Prunus armeniaca]
MDWPKFGELYVFKILSEVLSSINKVETLALNRETTMVIFFPSMAIGNCQSETLYSTLTDQAVFCGDFMPLLLENVCYLSIHVGSFCDMLVPGMVSTFQGMCNLSTLEIMSDPEFFEPKTDPVLITTQLRNSIPGNMLNQFHGQSNISAHDGFSGDDNLLKNRVNGFDE